MTRSYITSATLISTLAVARMAYGDQPPDVVQSDSHANTAMGNGVLQFLTGGDANTGMGTEALGYTTDGEWNTAAGFWALLQNTVGDRNSAFGVQALQSNVSGGANSAFGITSLYSNNTGNENTAIGYDALFSNTTGSVNAALGTHALYSNTTANNNTAVGPSAMSGNTTGSSNTAVGASALATNQGGSNNIAIGANAGVYVRGGRYNIEIGNVGTANDAGTIRIGISSQQSTAYIAGITSAHVTGSAVYISSTGQLGVLASSERYKTNVASMGSSSQKVRELRPVTFRLNTDPKAGVQYGLIAEEVAKVYPELVIRGDKGKIEGVRYEELTPMLLNEVQQQQRTIAAQGKQLHDMQEQLAELQEFRRSMQGRAANQ